MECGAQLVQGPHFETQHSPYEYFRSHANLGPGLRAYKLTSLSDVESYFLRD